MARTLGLTPVEVLVFASFAFCVVPSARCRNLDSPFAGDVVASDRMREIYEEVKTPHKVGMVLVPEDGEMFDNPTVFRHGKSWYMMFIRFDGKGYETHLAKSDDLQKWTRLGRIFSRGANGAWDSAQADGWPALVDTRWDGPNTLNTFGGKYWMMYLGGAADGYETDPLSTGVAWTEDPSAVREWTRCEGNPVMRSSDPDVRDFEKKTIYRHFTVDDPSRSCGGRFVNFYNAKQLGVWREAIGMAVSDDMLHWRRVGGGPVIDNGDADKPGLSGDPMIRRIGDTWVMFYFGYGWKPGIKGAFDTFACSYDLKCWTKWDGEPLVKPSGSYDNVHAHKPWVMKYNGVVYHWYCAVGKRDGREVRGIALATSRFLKATAATCSGAGARVTTSVPGWTFTETEKPVFVLSDIAQRVYWTLEDWRGRPIQSDVWPTDGNLTLRPLPPGYYHVKCSDVARRVPASFTFCVVPSARCRSLDSPFAADAALSGCSRRGVYDCPWYGGDCWHVTAELLGKCGLVHTRERLEWGNFIEPKKGQRDFSRYLASAKAMKANGVVSTGLFHDTPPWMRRAGRKLPGDLVELYRFMEDAARTFDPYYDSWEFWNEQELGSTTEPCWEYVAALKAFALGTRAGSAKTIILPGALSYVDFLYGLNMFAGDIAKYVQAFNIHTYENPCSYGSWHDSLRRFLAEAGVPDWQVWLTESGTNLEGNGRRPCPGRPKLMAHTEDQEMVLAEFYPKSCILHRQAGIVRNWYFMFGCYNEQDGARDWGSMRRDGTVKPIHAAMAAVSSELGDATLLGEKRLGEGLRGFVFAKQDGSRTLAFWSLSNLECPAAPPITARSENLRTVSLNLPDGTYRLVDMMGMPSSVVAKDGKLTLESLRYPQYLSGLGDIAVDVPATDIGKIAGYTPPADEDLTVVIRPETNPEDFSITGRKCIAELEKQEGRMRIEVWNLSPEAKKGQLTVSEGRLAGGDGEIEIAPWNKTIVEATFMPPVDKARFDLDIAGVFNGRRATRVRIPVVNVPKLLAECESVPLPALNDPAAWKRNDSGSKYSCVYDTAEKAVRFDVEWNRSSGVWFFPVHEFAPGESFAGGRYLEFEVKSRQDKVENDMGHVEVMCLYKNGRPVKKAPFKAQGFEWEKRRALLPDDAADMRGFRMGGLPRGRKLTYWVRNFRLIRRKGETTTRKDEIK